MDDSTTTTTTTTTTTVTPRSRRWLGSIEAPLRPLIPDEAGCRGRDGIDAVNRNASSKQKGRGGTLYSHVIRFIAHRSHLIYHDNYPDAKYINLSCLHKVEIVVQSLVISRRVSPIVEERSRARTRHQQKFRQYELMPER
jgi:hypothetical protein